MTKTMGEPSGAALHSCRPRIRIFLGLTEIAGYYGNLSRGFEELGVRATFVNVSGHPFRYDADSANALVRGVDRARRGRLAAAASPVRRLGWTLFEGLLRCFLFAWALASFDVFIFAFGATFLSRPGFELRLLRLLRKRIICVYHGSDSRPPFLDGSLMASARAQTGADCVRLTRETKRRVSQLDRHADWVIESPMCGHFHERECVRWFSIGVPYAMRGQVNPPATLRDRALRIVHSPSHPEAKGTPHIRRAIENLRAKGYAIEFVEVIGRPHSEVVRELLGCDFVIDQLYSDTPMAGFATEAAYFGKPAVVGGYGAAAFRKWIPPSEMPPSAYCHPEELESTVERLILDGQYRRELGQAAQDFVRQHWSPRQVAARYLRLIRGDVPPGWLFDPREVRYVHGCALPEERARALVTTVVALEGQQALQLSDKPALERELMQFAYAGSNPVVGCSSSS